MAPQRRGACWQCYPANRDGCRRPLRHRYPCIAVLNRSNSLRRAAGKRAPVGLHVGARAGAAGGTRRGPRRLASARAVDLRSWWTALDDPRLNALVEEALRRNLDLEQSARLLQGEREVAGRWRSRYLPGFGVGARPVQDAQAKDSYFHASIDMVWELGLFGAAESSRLQAGADADRRRSRAGPARVGGRGRGAQLSGPGRGQRSDRAADADGRAGPRGRAAGAGAAEHPPGHAAGRRHGQRAPAAHPGRAGVDAPAADRSARALALLLGRDAPDPGWSAVAPSQGLPGFALGKCRPTCCAPVRTSARPKPKCFGPPQGWAWRARRCIRA